MLRARAPVGQGLGGPWLLTVTKPSRCKHSSTASVVASSSPLCRHPRVIAASMVAIRSSAVARLSLDFIVAPPIEVSRSFGSRRSHPRQQGPQQPTRSGRSLFPATPMISGAAIAVGYRLRRDDPSESRLNRDACPQPTPQAARRQALQACHRCCVSAASEDRGRSARTARLRPPLEIVRHKTSFAASNFFRLGRRALGRRQGLCYRLHNFLRASANALAYAAS